MFCSKCGTRVADDDYACYMCGARLNNNTRSALEVLLENEARMDSLDKQEERTGEDVPDDPIEATVRDMFEKRAGEYREDSNEDVEYMQKLLEEAPGKKKTGKPLIVAVLVVVAALAVGGIYLWNKGRNCGGEELFEPIAIENIEPVAELLDKIPSEEKKEEVKQEEKISQIARVRELRDGYMNDEVTYDEVMEEFEVLKDKVYDDADEFDTISEYIERIETSREGFRRAERDFDKGNYAEAYAGYGEVLREDEVYHKKAEERRDDCNKAVQKLVEGKWSYEYDARAEVEQYVKSKGFNVDLSKMKIPIVFLFDLKSDGSIDVSIDYDALEEYIDKILDLAVDTVNNGLESGGIVTPGVSSWLKDMYGKTGIKDKIKKELDLRGTLDSMMTESGIDGIDSYSVKDCRLFIGTAGMDVRVKNDMLTLTSEGNSALAVGSYKMPYPIKMKAYKASDGDESGETEKNTQTTTENTDTQKNRDNTTDKKDTRENTGNTTDKKDTRENTGNTTDKKDTRENTGNTSDKSTGNN